MLHLWSLGVEEQFYIVWPALLALTWRWRRARLPLLLAIAGGSFLFNVARVGTHPAATFYLLPTRLWELALGGLLASRPARALPAALSNPMAALGAALVLGAVFTLDGHRSFPGIWALVPTLGTALVIAAGEGAWINRRVLASGPVVFLGLISYPLYLWHWPLLSLMRIIGGSHGDGLETFTALALAVLLAVLTWYLLERPLRGVRPATRIAPALFTVLALIGVLGVLTVRLPIAPLSARYGFERILAAAAEQRVIPFPGPHLQPMRTAGGQLLRQGTAAHSVLFLGDSNVEQYYPRIDELLLRYGARARSAVFASDGGCVPIPGVREPEHAYCDGLVERARAYARSSAVDTVVIAAAWARYFGPAAQDARDAYYFSAGRFSGPVSEGTEGARRALASLAGMVSELVRLGKRVVIVLQIPTDDALDPRAMIRRSVLTMRFTPRTAPLDRAQLEAGLASVDAPLRRIARDSGAVIVDPFDSLCDRRSCPALTPEGEPMYRDDMHLRPSYVREHVRFLDAFLLEP